MKRITAFLIIFIVLLNTAFVKAVEEQPGQNESFTLGAIRWDAWYGDNEEADGTYSEVMRSLSPAKYHFRAPFYAQVTSEGNVIIPEYTQEIFDKEMEYAIEGGIDYFAYVWYSNGGLRRARDFHTSSKYKNQVKMTGIIDTNSLGNASVKNEIVSLMKESFWMTVLGNKPILYFFVDDRNAKIVQADIEKFKTLTQKEGLPDPYFVFMQNDINTAVVRSTGADAASMYSVWGEDGLSFNGLLFKAEKEWENGTGYQVVPNVPTGWDTRTRADNQVSWMHCEKNSWAQTATADDIYKAFTKAFQWMDAHKACTQARTLITYAWNEHDEGGWLCPTIAVDENGNQLKNGDGTNKTDDSRIQALKRAVLEYKGAASNENAEKDNTSETDNGAVQANINRNNTLIYLVTCVCGILIVGAVSVAAVRRKKKK